MATLRERRTYRGKILPAVHEGAGGNRPPGVDGMKLRDDLATPEQERKNVAEPRPPRRCGRRVCDRQTKGGRTP